MSYILMFILSISLTACIKVTDKDSESSAQMIAQKQNEASTEIRLDGGEPHQYKVHIPLKENIHLVRRISLNNLTEQQFLNPQLDQGGFVDSSVVSGQSYSYEMGIWEDNEFQVRESLAITIPVDLEIKGEVILSEDTKWSYGRIFVHKNSRLLTQGHRLQIEAKEIIADGGVIETFPSFGSQPGKGRNGSIISIQTETARGLLSFILRGENGAKGIQGYSSQCRENNGGPMTSAEDGQVGQDGGNTGFFKMQISQPHELQVEVSSVVGLAGPGGDAGGGCYASSNNAKMGSSGRDGQKQISCLFDYQGEHCY